MANLLNDFSDRLIEIIDSKGLNYLDYEPFEIYQQLDKFLKEKYPGHDEMLPACFLLSLLTNIQSYPRNNKVDKIKLLNLIQDKCQLNDFMSACVAQIYAHAFTEKNKKRWAKNTDRGFKEFISEEQNFNLKSTGTWAPNHRPCQDYTFYLKLTLKVSRPDIVRTDLRELLIKNQFMSCDDIRKYYANIFYDVLDDEFSEYCEGEGPAPGDYDWYPPVVEDFDFDELRESIKMHGFEIIDSQSDYSESDFY